MKHSLILSCFVLLLCSCGNDLQKTTQAKMQEMAALSELGTVEYTVTKVIKGNDVAWYTIGDRKVLFSCQAKLKAGIDMSEFNPSKVVINGKNIEITLPQPKLLAMNMPAEEAKLVYQKVGALRKDISATERNELLKLGEADIVENVPNLGILDDARKNAETFFRALLKQLGYENVTVKFA